MQQTITADDVVTELAEATEASREIAASVEAVSAAVSTLLNTGLTRRSLVLLIREQTKGYIKIAQIEAVLDGMAQLNQSLAQPTEEIEP